MVVEGAFLQASKVQPHMRLLTAEGQPVEVVSVPWSSDSIGALTTFHWQGEGCLAWGVVGVRFHGLGIGWGSLRFPAHDWGWSAEVQHGLEEVGVFGPATESGLLLVDGILCSVYAKPSDFQAVKVADVIVHRCCHWATAPLRAWWRLQLALGFASKVPTGTASCTAALKWAFGPAVAFAFSM